MTSERRKPRARIDDDGVKVVEVAGVRRGVWLLVFALLLCGAAGLLALRLVFREIAPREPDVSLAAAATQARVPEPAPEAVRRDVRPVRRASAPPPAPDPLAAPAPEPAELPAFPEETGDAPSGIALFPPPGTDPPKRGLLVPEDFELPEGFVRHYQATDDGEGLAAILMFHPDYEWFDANGDAVALPPDLVVPPEMAPPDLPREWLEIPPGQPDPAP